MATHLISYDLVAPGKDYAKLLEQIKTYGNWWHCLDSTWIVKSDRTCLQIRDHLGQYIDANDRLLVVQLNGVGAWLGFNQECSTWLKNNL